MHSSRVYYPCILCVEMLEIRISLASPLLALNGGWEAGIMNKHTPIMDTLPTFHQEKEYDQMIQVMMITTTAMSKMNI